MVIACNICQMFANMTVQNISDHCLEGKEKHYKEHAVCIAHEAHRKA